MSHYYTNPGFIPNKGQEFSRKDVVAEFRYPPRTVESIIKKFFDMNRLDKIGQGKATRYRLRQP